MKQARKPEAAAAMISFGALLGKCNLAQLGVLAMRWLNAGPTPGGYTQCFLKVADWMHKKVGRLIFENVDRDPQGLG